MIGNAESRKLADPRGRMRAQQEAGPVVALGMDREAAARAIADAAKQARKPLPRGLWIAAIVVSVVCVGALAIGWLTGGPAPAPAHPLPRTGVARGGGFGAGLLIGVGVGIAIGSLLALRRRDRGDR